MSSKTIRERASELRQGAAWFKEEKRRIMADERYSDDYKREVLKITREVGYKLAHAVALETLGRKGSLWKELQAAKERIRAERDKAEIVAYGDSAMLAIASARLPATVKGCFDASEFDRWWGGASTAEKLSVALHGEEMIRAKFGTDAGRLVAQARRFLEERLDTPDRRSAIAERDAVDAAGCECCRALDGCAVEYGDGSTLAVFDAGGEETFAGISAHIHRLDEEGNWAVDEARRYEAPQVFGGNAAEGGDEGGEPAGQ